MTKDDPRNNGELPVLLGYRISVPRRLFFMLLACMLTAGVALVMAVIYDALTPPAYHISRGILLLFAIPAGMGLARQVIAAFECLGPGMNTANLLGEVRGIPWEDVRELKRLIGPITVLRLRKGSYLLIGVPKPILDQLIAILRETTNARIVGFDHGS